MTKTELQNNNLDLRNILTKINNLPDKSSSGEDITEEVNAQDVLIEQIQTALQGKAVPPSDDPSTQDAIAVITVTYPEGSTCTCTKGEVVLTLTDTSGQGFFLIPELGDWIVNCTDGTVSQSETVSVIITGQGTHIKLTYELVLFDAGTYAEETDGWSKSGSTLSISASTTSMDGATDTVYTRSKVDVSGYNKLHFQITSTSQTQNGYRRVGVSSTTSGSGFVAYADISTRGEAIIDISDVDDAYYIRMALEAWPPQNGMSSSTSIVASKVWLTT